MLHPRLPNLQQLFLKRNHRISTSRNTSSLSYPDIVLYLIPHFSYNFISRESASASARGSGFLLRSTDLHANHARLSKAYTSKKHYICWWELLSILPINSRRNLRVATNFSTTESKYIGLFPNAWISLTYRTYRGSVFLLINEEISDKLWESALADPFQFTIYSRQKASLSRYGAREDASYYKAMYIW